MNRFTNRLFWAICSLALLTFLLPPNALAAPPTEHLPRLIVTGYRTPKNISELGYVVRVIDKAELDALPATNLADVLNQSSSLSMSKAGGQSSIFLKGFSSNQYKIYVDGFQIKDAASPQGTPALDMIPISAIERIEILSGQGSALHGSDAMGGVIQLFTAKAKRNLQGQFNQSLAPDYSSTSFFVGGRGNDSSVNLNYAREFDKRTSALRDGDEKDANNTKSLNVNLSKEFDGFSLGGSFGYFTGLSDYDGSVNSTDLSTVSDNPVNRIELEQFQWQTILGLRHSQDWETTFTYSESDLRRDHASKFIDFFSGQPTLSNFFYTGGLQDFEVKTYKNWGKDISLTSGYSHKRETIDGTFVSTRRTKSSDALFAEVDWANPILSVRLGGRSDSFETDDADTYSVSLYRKIPVLGTVMYTQRTGYREPSLFEIATSENVQLKAEKSEVKEIGLLKQFGNIDFTASFFDNTVSDKIDYAFPIYFNQSGDASSKGSDYGITIRDLGVLDHLSINYTQTRARQADGTPLQRVPESKFTASTRYSLDQFSASLSAETVGKRYDFNDIKLHGYTVFHAKFAYALSDTQESTITIENLFDEDYEELFGYETPGRTLFWGFTQRF